MEIKASKLKELMELVKPAIARRPTAKSVTCLSLGNGKAVATDLETMIIANVPEAEAPMLLPYSQIAEMLKYVPGHETLKIEQKGKAVSLSWNEGSASYPTEDFADFPVLPAMTARAEELVDGDTLIAAVKSVLPYTAGDDTRPTLSGVTLMLGSPTSVAAGDGFRMAYQAMGILFPLEEKVIVPARSVAILEHVFMKTPRTPPVTSDSLIKVVIARRQLRLSLIEPNKLRLDFGTSASVVINLIQGQPPAWVSLIPKGEPILQRQLFAPQLEAAVKRVGAITRKGKDGHEAVRLQFLTNGKLEISACVEDQEISSSIDPVTTMGEVTKIAFNIRYLLDVLNGKTGIITFSRYTDTGPAVFEYQKLPKVLIMPMQVSWPDDTTPPASAEPKAETADQPSDNKTTDESEASTEEETSEAETIEEKPVTE